MGASGCELRGGVTRMRVGGFQLYFSSVSVNPFMELGNHTSFPDFHLRSFSLDVLLWMKDLASFYLKNGFYA